MSENLNRSNPDFSKYDSMSIGELEEILRADAQGPERVDSDVDEILYVMEVLAKKRRQNGIAGKTALEAYQEFQQHYLPMVEEEPKPKRKSNIIPFRRIAAVAASLVLVFSLSVTANAFSFRDVWNAVVTWAQETFSFSMGVEVSEPKADSELEYNSLQELLIHNNIDLSVAPSIIPDGFKMIEAITDKNPKQESYVATYSNGVLSFTISVQTYLPNQSEQVETSHDYFEIYTISEHNYYIFGNYSHYQAVWIANSFECSISGELSIEDIKLMLDSIEKG